MRRSAILPCFLMKSGLACGWCAFARTINALIAYHNSDSCSKAHRGSVLSNLRHSVLYFQSPRTCTAPCYALPYAFTTPCAPQHAHFRRTSTPTSTMNRLRHHALIRNASEAGGCCTQRETPLTTNRRLPENTAITRNQPWRIRSNHINTTRISNTLDLSHRPFSPRNRVVRTRHWCLPQLRRTKRSAALF